MMNIQAVIVFLLTFPLVLSAQNGISGYQTGMTGSMRGLDVVSEKVVWISGTNGEFSVTGDQGKTWFHDTVPGGHSLDFRDVQGFSADEALLMSAGPGKASSIYLTENGGKSWSLTYQNTDGKVFFDGMDFFDRKHGLLIGDPVDEKPYLLETLDGGRTWHRLIPEEIPGLVSGEYAFAASGTSLDACSDGSCWIATGGSVARAFHSSDRGKTWKVANLPVLQGDPAAGAFSIQHGPGENVASAGGNYQKMTLSGSNITLSGDHGKTWFVPAGAASVPFMECIRWIGQETLVTCGPPGVWISNDSGGSWKELSKDGFHAMDVVIDKKLVWLAGNKGKVIRIELPAF